MEPRRSFRFLKELSEGAFGKVYLAEMATGDNFKSVVAIKLLHGKWADHEEIVQRSRDEARVLGLLHHRNIIRVEDLTSINGQCAIIMEFLDGVDLKNIVNDIRDRGERVPRRVIFDVGAQVAAALEAAYHHKPLQGGDPLQLIHRDIKPSNVMLTRAGDVKVLDFGTAQAKFDHREAKTQALAFGSAAYMAPERLLGDPDAPSGDIFSLGVTLYELLALQSFGKIHIRPEKFEAKLERRINELDLADLPPERAEQVRATMRLLLAYEAGDRPTSQQVVDLLEALAETIHDGSMRRFCRDVVSPLRNQLEPEQDPNDPLTGSTLFEDASGLSRFTDEGESSDSGLRQSPSHTWIAEIEGEDEASAEPQSIPADQPGAQPEAPPQTLEAPGPERSGVAQVQVGGGAPAPALSMPERPSIAPFDPTITEDPFAQEDDLATTRVAPMESPADPSSSGLRQQDPVVEIIDDQPGIEIYEDEPAPASIEPAEPVEPAEPAKPAEPADPSDAEAGIEVKPIKPTLDRPASAPDFPDGDDLFTAPTVHLRARQEDDLYDEYGEDERRPEPRRQAFVPPTPRPAISAPPQSQLKPQPQPQPKPQPADKPSGGGMKLAIGLILALLVLGGVAAAAVVAAGVIGGGKEETAPEPEPEVVVHTVSDADLLPGGTVQVAAPGPTRGTARLEMAPAEQAVVEVISQGGEKWRWNGEGVLELVGLEPGLYRTKVTPRAGGASSRGSFEIEAGSSCVFRFEAGGSGDWVKGACQ